MKIYKYLAAMGIGAMILIAAACDVENPIETEQYKKVVYLVGAFNKMQQKDIAYGGEQEFYVSVAVGGSLKTDHDVTVKIGEAHQVNIDNYNWKHVTEGDVKYLPLPPTRYSIPSKTATIKAGEQYARIPIKIQTDGIDSDMRYLIPLTIVELSDFEVNRDDTVLLVNPVMVNEYSGSGMFIGTSYNVTYEGNEEVIGNAASMTNTPRTLQAIDKNTVRIFHKAEMEKLSNVDNYALLLKMNPADNTVSIEACKNLKILRGGGSYHPANRTYSIWYNYKETVTIEGKRVEKEYRMEAEIKMNPN